MRPSSSTNRALPNNPPAPQPEAEDDEDDYMKMTFTDAPPPPETSFQRHKRLKREAEIKGHTRSKADLAAEANATREAGLASSLFGDSRNSVGDSITEKPQPKSKGFAMMAKMGFKAGSVLGASGAEYGKEGPAKEPIRLELKSDRGGIGADAEKKRKAAEEWEAAVEEAKRRKQDEGDYVTRVRREREVERLEKLVGTAQRLAEGMEEDREKKAREDGEEAQDGDDSTTKKNGRKRGPPPSYPTLKSINVLWRGQVRKREIGERERRIRAKMLNSLSTYATEDGEDEDDGRATGPSDADFQFVEVDLDEDDPELEAFEASEVEQKLEKLVIYLRREHNYCFWCKYEYQDDTMDGCPGVTEEDHD